MAQTNYLTTEEYFHQRPHMNFFNKIYYKSGFFKKYMPFFEYRSLNPLENQRSAQWYGRNLKEAGWMGLSIIHIIKQCSINWSF